jgi:hypothetical protein
MTRNKMAIRLGAVVLLAMFALPGCNFTSSQLTGILQDLSAVGVSAIFENISTAINPDADEDLQSIIDIGEDATQTAVDNGINNYIPDDPK